jgi:hypothetical protein
VVLAGDVLHEFDGGAVGDEFGGVVPAGVLLGAEVGAVEDLLQADDLRAGVGGLLDEAEVLLDHARFGFSERRIGGGCVRRLNEGTVFCCFRWGSGAERREDGRVGSRGVVRECRRRVEAHFVSWAYDATGAALRLFHCRVSGLESAKDSWK